MSAMLLLIFDSDEDAARFASSLSPDLTPGSVVEVSWRVVPGAKWRAWYGQNASDQTIRGLIRSAPVGARGASPVVWFRALIAALFPRLGALLDERYLAYAASYAKAKYHKDATYLATYLQEGF